MTKYQLAEVRWLPNGGQTPNARKTPNAKKIPPEQWAMHKAEICEMYKSLTLEKLMEWMTSKRNFQATLNQYTRQLALWGIRKASDSSSREPTLGQGLNETQAGMEGDIEMNLLSRSSVHLQDPNGRKRPTRGMSIDVDGVMSFLRTRSPSVSTSSDLTVMDAIDMKKGNPPLAPSLSSRSTCSSDYVRFRETAKNTGMSLNIQGSVSRPAQSQPPPAPSLNEGMEAGSFSPIAITTIEEIEENEDDIMIEGFLKVTKSMIPPEGVVFGDWYEITA